MGINLELYKVFYETARLGSVTSAADALFLSQPAVSQQIKQLEQALQTQLFIRSSRGVQLTPEGRVLYAQVAPAYESIRLGERKLAQMRNLESGELCIGASDMTLKFCLLPYLERFHSAHSGIHIRVTNAPHTRHAGFPGSGPHRLRRRIRPAARIDVVYRPSCRFSGGYFRCGLPLCFAAGKIALTGRPCQFTANLSGRSLQHPYRP